MRTILEAVFHDFGTEFLDAERLEASSLLKDYLSIHFGLNEAAQDVYISTILQWLKPLNGAKKSLMNKVREQIKLPFFMPIYLLFYSFANKPIYLLLFAFLFRLCTFVLFRY